MTTTLRIRLPAETINNNNKKSNTSLKNLLKEHLKVKYLSLPGNCNHNKDKKRVIEPTNLFFFLHTCTDYTFSLKIGIKNIQSKAIIVIPSNFGSR